MTANTEEQSGGTGFQRFSPEELARESAPSPAPLKAQSPAPQIIRNPGEQKAAPVNLPDAEATLKAPAPIAPFVAGAIPTAPKEPKEPPQKAQTAPSDSDLRPQEQPEPVAPRSTINLLDSAKAQDAKAVIPKWSGIWWNTTTDGSGAELKMRWREGERQPAFNFRRISKDTLESWRALPEEERKEAVREWLLADEGLEDRPEAKERLEKALSNVKVSVRKGAKGAKGAK